MTRFVRMSLSVSLALAGVVVAMPRASLVPDDVAILRPGDVPEGSGWSGDRMGSARERLKDMLPGGPA